MIVPITIADVREANPRWFSKENKRFFDDISYRILHDKGGTAYLVRQTWGWGNMGKHWRVNQLNNNSYAIGVLLPDTFLTLNEVKTWLKGDHGRFLHGRQ